MICSGTRKVTQASTVNLVWKFVDCCSMLSSGCIPPVWWKLLSPEDYMVCQTRRPQCKLTPIWKSQILVLGLQVGCNVATLQFVFWPKWWCSFNCHIAISFRTPEGTWNAFADHEFQWEEYMIQYHNSIWYQKSRLSWFGFVLKFWHLHLFEFGILFLCCTGRLWFRHQSLPYLAQKFVFVQQSCWRVWAYSFSHFVLAIVIHQWRVIHKNGNWATAKRQAWGETAMEWSSVLLWSKLMQYQSKVYYISNWSKNITVMIFRSSDTSLICTSNSKCSSYFMQTKNGISCIYRKV